MSLDTALGVLGLLSRVGEAAWALLRRAIAQRGHLFTVDVAIGERHTLCDWEVYRWLRHPPSTRPSHASRAALQRARWQSARLRSHQPWTREEIEAMNAVTRTLTAVIVLGMAVSASHAQSNSVTQFEQLKQPRISTKRPQKMLVVEATGDPNVVGGQAFGLLFQLYYRLPEAPKGPLQALPLARWPEDLATPKAQWTGLYALPVPESVSAVPDYAPQPGLRASLATWEYGEVAEILHLGPYDREEPTIQRLREFIRQQGYVVVGGHEEEYISGPTQGGRGDPERYQTIIRYRVRKADGKHTGM